MNIRFLCLALAASIAIVSCERSRSAAEADSAETEAKELSPSERVTLQMAKVAVASAFDSASSSSLREIELDMRSQTQEPPEEIAREDARRLTIFFASNNRGEREDCGCRKNPLGGLARRHTMIEALKDEELATEIWEKAGTAPGPVFHVDAGNALFKTATLGRGSPSAQKVAKHDANTIVKALNTFPPDAFLAGELELTFGLEYLQKLTADAKFPILSANLKTQDGKSPFPGSVVVERDGRKVGVVGVTKKETRYGDYWEDRGLVAEEPVDAVKKELAGLPDDLDAVVLLSNLGLNDTGALIDALGEEAQRRLALAVVSGSNRLTGDPEYSSGVPLVEPLSRGKYVGRADLLLNGNEIEYRNAAGVTATTLRDYRRALRSYWTTRRQLARQRKQLAQLEARSVKVSEKASKAEEGKDASALEKLDERRAGAIDSRRERVETLENRLETVSGLLEEKVANLRPREASQGDDWIVSHVVPVRIEFAQEPATRRLVSRYEKRRPKEEVAPRGPAARMKQRQLRRQGKEKASGDDEP